MAGATSKPGFGSIEQKVDQRNQEETNQYDISSNIELGKLIPEKSKVYHSSFCWGFQYDH